MPSFDVVSEVDWAEVKNALVQAQKEIAQRYDFRGAEASVELAEKAFVVSANSEDRAQAVLEVLKEKLIKRKVALEHLEEKPPVPGSRGIIRINVLVKEGIESEKAKAIVKRIKDAKLKVQAAIMDDLVRVTGKKRDDLQEAIALLRSATELELAMTYKNFRD